MRRIVAVGLVALAACGGSKVRPTADPFAVKPAPVVDACSAPKRSPSLGAAHLNPGQRGTYNSDPPTSGAHYGAPGGPVPAGIHPTPIENEAQVHNLEHGHVVIQYRALSSDQVHQLRQAVFADPVQIVLAPRPGMRHHVALTAWTVLQTCDGFPADPIGTVRAFVAAYRNHAPESFP